MGMVKSRRIMLAERVTSTGEERKCIHDFWWEARRKETTKETKTSGRITLI
jgi:hypothetical protein